MYWNWHIQLTSWNPMLHYWQMAAERQVLQFGIQLKHLLISG